MASDKEDLNRELVFPKGFCWGASTSSHQVEGGLLNDWSEWEKSKASELAKNSEKKFANWMKSWDEVKSEAQDPQNYISGLAADHFNKFKEDFSLAKSLSHNSTRFSLEWSRIEPEEGKFSEEGLAHYREVISSARENGLEPFVTIWHWPLPLWLRDKGGWESKDVTRHFEKFARKVAEEIPGVRFWITINEPDVYSHQSYFSGNWPPQKRSLRALIRVTTNLIEAHNFAYKAIKSVSPEAQIGIAKHNTYFEAEPRGAVNRALKSIADWWWNFYILEGIKDHQDFIGLNHYFHNRINWGFNKNENLITSDMGWELYPEAIYYVLLDLKRYDKPIYITENGLADRKDEKRGWFIVETLKWVHRAIEDGVDVKGYLHWSLMDNFEWDKGFWPRFGLIEVDRKSMERKPRASSYLYGEIAKQNRISEDILSKFSDLISLKG